MELMVPIDNQSRSPLYEQIYQYMKEEIRGGRMAAGSRLPSTRILAANLKVSRSTTQMAYEQLLSEGYIEALPCRGYFVSRIEELVEVHKKEESPFSEKQGQRKEPYLVDFSPRGIDLDSFPFNTWRKLSRNTLVDDNKEMFAVGDPQGEYGLRAAIGDYLHSARGVNCRPEQILIGAGSEYLLMLLSQLLGRGTGIALENPTYRQAYRVLKSLGHQVFPVKMDRCKKADRYVIEDDYDSEFRYKGRPIPALQGMDQAGKVIYLGTFSRSIAPAIRVGFMVLPEPLLARYRMQAGFYACTVSRIDQNVLYHFITGGYYERHLNRMRAVYKGKHDALLGGLKELENIFQIRGEYAGIHVLLTHRKGMEEEKLVERAAQAGVKVYGMSGSVIGEEKDLVPSTVILGYASLKEEEICKGCRLLNEAWR